MDGFPVEQMMKYIILFVSSTENCLVEADELLIEEHQEM